MVVAVANAAAAAAPTAVTATAADADSPVSLLEDEVICSSKTSVFKSLGRLHFLRLGAIFEFLPIRFSTNFDRKEISNLLP
jgi:hypothetical protein